MPVREEDRIPPGHGDYVEPGTSYAPPPPAVPNADYTGTLQERSVDQVKRRERFITRHPEVSITAPRQNGTREWEASWPVPHADGDDPVYEKATHYELRYLLDYLEARWDRGDMKDVRQLRRF